jgi:hypothetical protein
MPEHGEHRQAAQATKGCETAAFCTAGIMPEVA